MCLFLCVVWYVHVKKMFFWGGCSRGMSVGLGKKDVFGGKSKIRGFCKRKPLTKKRQNTKNTLSR